MVATTRVCKDGHWYEPGEEIWDLGHWDCADDASVAQRTYFGLSSETDKLPHYVDSGSSAMCVDTGDVLIFLKTTDTWYQQ